MFYIVFIHSQDGDPPGCGTTTTEIGDPVKGWVWVQWDTGKSYDYRMGHEERYDLFLAEEG